MGGCDYPSRPARPATAPHTPRRSRAPGIWKYAPNSVPLLGSWTWSRSRLSQAYLALTLEQAAQSIRQMSSALTSPDALHKLSITKCTELPTKVFRSAQPRRLLTRTINTELLTNVFRSHGPELARRNQPHYCHRCEGSVASRSVKNGGWNDLKCFIFFVPGGLKSSDSTCTCNCSKDGGV